MIAIECWILNDYIFYITLLCPLCFDTVDWGQEGHPAFNKISFQIFPKFYLGRSQVNAA